MVSVYCASKFASDSTAAGENQRTSLDFFATVDFNEGPTCKGPDQLTPIMIIDNTACESPCLPAREPFLLVRFLCGFTKKMNPDVGPGPDDLVYLISNIKPFKPSGLVPTGDCLFLVV